MACTVPSLLLVGFGHPDNKLSGLPEKSSRCAACNGYWMHLRPEVDGYRRLAADDQEFVPPGKVFGADGAAPSSGKKFI
jgi:hypothetical protein